MTEKHRATVYIEQDLWNWLRKHAIDKRQSASEILEQLIANYKNQSPEIPAKEKTSNKRKK